MKTLLLNCLLIVILLVSCSSPSESPLSEQSKIIGTPIKIGSFEVAQNDLPNQMNLNDAKKACADLGNGWRLPTKDELNLIYLNKDKIGGFASSNYWSSSEDDINYAWFQSFLNGYQTYSNKYEHNYFVRAVRSF